MDAKNLEQYVHHHIPLTQIMGVKVREATDDKIVLFAPLEPNINHMHNIFGGSATTVAILAAWCLVFNKLALHGVAGHVVIHKNSMLYEKPIAGGFIALAQNIKPEAWEKVVNTLARHRMARIVVSSILEFEGEKVGQFEGEFVVLPDHGSNNTVKI